VVCVVSAVCRIWYHTVLQGCCCVCVFTNRLCLAAFFALRVVPAALQRLFSFHSLPSVKQAAQRQLSALELTSLLQPTLT
jgi:hypothetical protein